MIYTRFGTPVKVISHCEDAQGEWITVQYEDGDTRELHRSELRADNGEEEIHAAIVSVIAFGG